MIEIHDNEMTKALAELWAIQRDIELQHTVKSQDWVENKLRELLNKVRTFVEKFEPESYTVSVGFPWGANVGFTWSGKGKPEVEKGR